MWLWVSLPRATFAIHIKDGEVNEAPPIARWSIGMKAEDIIIQLCEIKDSRIIRMEDYAKEAEH